MNFNDEQLKVQLKKLEKQAWFPIVEQLIEHSSPLQSKFSGIAYIPQGTDWPKCGHCGQEMQLFLQLNANHLPTEAPKAFGEGILQVFYCTNSEMDCEIACESFFPFSKAMLVRVIVPNDEYLELYETSPVKDAFAEKTITGWQAKSDYPGWEELSYLGIELSDEEADSVGEQGFPIGGDKFLGWPAWIQGVEYPNCPQCGTKMKFIFQIDSEDNLPYMFGDAGCAYVTQCENDPSVLTIAWACT